MGAVVGKRPAQALNLESWLAYVIAKDQYIDLFFKVSIDSYRQEQEWLGAISHYAAHAVARPVRRGRRGQVEPDSVHKGPGARSPRHHGRTKDA